MSSKRCFKCLCVKPLDQFYRHTRTADGRLNKCIECTRADVAKHRLENIERIRAYDRMRGSQPHRVAARKEYAKTPAGRQAHQRALKASALRHPGREKARYAVSNAIRDGRLTPWPCEVCGTEEAEGHHPDYSRPLMVVWLCPPHHREAHQLHKEAA